MATSVIKLISNKAVKVYGKMCVEVILLAEGNTNDTLPSIML